MPKAARLAEKLLDEHKNNISSLELVPSSGGVFEVLKDGKLVFSKKELNRFPDEGEVESLVRS